MAPPRYKIKLTAAERLDLERLTKTDKTSARKFAIARALLLCDGSEAGPGWKVADVAAALGITTRTVEHLKRRVAEAGTTTINHNSTPTGNGYASGTTVTGPNGGTASSSHTTTNTGDGSQGTTTVTGPDGGTATVNHETTNP